MRYMSTRLLKEPKVLKLPGDTVSLIRGWKSVQSKKYTTLGNRLTFTEDGNLGVVDVGQSRKSPRLMVGRTHGYPILSVNLQNIIVFCGTIRWLSTPRVIFTLAAGYARMQSAYQHEPMTWFYGIVTADETHVQEIAGIFKLTPLP